MSQGTMTILEPRAWAKKKTGKAPAALADLKGKTIGLLRNQWLSVPIIFDRMEELLRTRYGVAGVRNYGDKEGVRTHGPITPAAIVDAVSRDCDALIVGLGH
ncbi:MAG: hypothetical protein ABID87_01125 [Chloroflexota bacterium]